MGKTIADLPALPAVSDETLIPVYQPGAADPAQKMKGAQFREFAEDCVTPYSDAARADAVLAVEAKNAAQNAYTGVQNAIKNIPAGSIPIVNDLTTGGATMALSAEQGKLLGQRPNPNLLDNWYFADPVNQRGGLVIPAGTQMYSDVALTIPAVVTSTVNPVQTTNGNVVGFTTGTANVWTAKTNAIRGYTGARVYAVDRWKLHAGGATFLVDEGRLVFGSDQYSGILQQVDNVKRYYGKTMTFSALFQNDAPFYLRVTFESSGTPLATYTEYCRAGSKRVSSVTFSVPTNATLFSIQIVTLAENVTGTVQLEAAKLELGSVQTLAHQDENGNWVLNEIPNYAEELAKCQRYQVVYEAGQLHGRAHAYAANGAYVTIALPAPLRAKPSFPNGGPLSVLVGGYATDANTVKVTGVTNASVNNNALSFFLATNGGLTAAANYPISATDKFIIDANL